MSTSKRNQDGTPVPAHLDPEPDRTTDPGAWHAWQHRDMLRIPASELVPVARERSGGVVCCRTCASASDGVYLGECERYAAYVRATW